MHKQEHRLPAALDRWKPRNRTHSETSCNGEGYLIGYLSQLC
jgi:hypothetical protein